MWLFYVSAKDFRVTIRPDVEAHADPFQSFDLFGGAHVASPFVQFLFAERESHLILYGFTGS